MKGDIPETLKLGTCFLCGKECEKFVHTECAIAWSDEREQWFRMDQREKDARYDKIIDKKLGEKE